ncbi:RNA polymerase sigma factor [Agathobaculum sp.]|uniref:RNA polymerase sigma factor n=1 Tax=Agathobaculum sp. TaxID=2048138 RepID=UPI002A83F602|nr:sigma-70 family RNA polymerase sigma factor [Agathobaculum sp.]MDY3617730.1 sigma-70 family RNA polymerase sigma factor [Agathobaculum sp.]
MESKHHMASDKAFILELYHKYKRLIYKYIYDITQDRQSVEDITNDVIVALISHIEKLHSLSESKRVSYIIRTTKNASLRYLIKSRRVTPLYTEPFDGDEIESCIVPPPQTHLSQVELRNTLSNAIANLSVRDQELLVSRYLLDYSDRELSEYTGIPEANIRTYVMRARKRLLKYLDADLLEEYERGKING